MIEEDTDAELDRILNEMIQPSPRTPLVETSESNIQFNGKHKVLSVEEIRANASVICGCTPEEYDHMVAREKILDLSKTADEFEQRIKKFDQDRQKLLGLTQEI